MKIFLLWLEPQCSFNSLVPHFVSVSSYWRDREDLSVNRNATKCFGSLVFVDGCIVAFSTDLKLWSYINICIQLSRSVCPNLTVTKEQWLLGCGWIHHNVGNEGRSLRNGTTSSSCCDALDLQPSAWDSFYLKRDISTRTLQETLSHYYQPGAKTSQPIRAL